MQKIRGNSFLGRRNGKSHRPRAGRTVNGREGGWCGCSSVGLHRAERDTSEIRVGSGHGGLVREFGLIRKERKDGGLGYVLQGR